MVSGTYILTDTIKGAFSTVFTRAYKHADAVVTGKSAIGTDNGNNGRATPPSLPASLLAQIQRAAAGRRWPPAASPTRRGSSATTAR